MTKTIERKILKLIKDMGFEHPLKLSDDVFNDVGFDSLDCVELIMIIEDEFSLDIPDNEAEELATIGEIIKYIEGKINGK